MRIQLTDQGCRHQLSVSIGGILSLDTNNESPEECIAALLGEVLTIAKDNPESIKKMLEGLR